MNIDETVTKCANELDAHIAEIIKWHFSPDTGSPFLVRLGKTTKLESP
jgi:hypothetical protein